jgi:SsrA-binding protein
VKWLPSPFGSSLRSQSGSRRAGALPKFNWTSGEGLPDCEQEDNSDYSHFGVGQQRSILLQIAKSPRLHCRQEPSPRFAAIIGSAHKFPRISSTLAKKNRTFETGATKSTAKPAPKVEEAPVRVLSENRRARHEYDILDTLECGIALLGSEVKSLRNGKVLIEDGYGRLKADELWLFGCEIPEYPQATMWNHEPKRPRKLLLRKPQLRKFAAKATEKGLTIVPLKLYFSARGFAKVLMAVAKGRKLHDKRDVLKKKDVQRDIQRALKSKR